MDDLKQTKNKIRKDMITTLESLSEDEIALKTHKIDNRLFDFANFVEANITMLYICFCRIFTQFAGKKYTANMTLSAVFLTCSSN